MRIFDLHCDTLDLLAAPTLPADLRTGSGFYAAMGVEGQLTDFAEAPGHLKLREMADYAWCQCLAVFVPDVLDIEQSRRFFEHVAGTLPVHATKHPDLLGIVRDAHEIGPMLARTPVVGLLTIEGGKLLAAAPDTVERVAEMGVKMITLTWNGENPLGSGHETHQGLTTFGRECVTRMEAAHVVVDVSHLNDEGFADLRHIARRPFVASHSNLRAVCDVPRNLTDDQFRAIRDAGGLVGINYYVDFVTDSRSDLAEGNYAPERLCAHIDRMLDLGGADVVALGSDFDGCSVPTWLAGAGKMGTLVRVLRERYGEEQAEKICWQNAYDFFVRNEG